MHVMVDVEANKEIKYVKHLHIYSWKTRIRKEQYNQLYGFRGAA